ncbi:hypothetical protein IBT54_000456 [Pantoea sp. S62]|nr:hypothetical protein [Pantoea sp. S62]
MAIAAFLSWIRQPGNPLLLEMLVHRDRYLLTFPVSMVFRKASAVDVAC